MKHANHMPKGKHMMKNLPEKASATAKARAFGQRGRAKRKAK